MFSLKSMMVAVALAALPTVAAAKPQESTAIAADVLVSVNGLVCDFCAQAIEKSLRRRAEVNAVKVDLTAKIVSIDFKPSADLDDAEIRRIITNAGYAVVDLRRTAATP